MLCAEGIIRDTETNRISVFQIFEHITPEGLPLLFTHFKILVFIDREDKDPSEIKFNLRINLNKEKLLEKAVSVNFHDKKRNRTIINVGGLTIGNPGILQASIWLDDKMLNEYKVIINEPRKPKVETRQG